MNWESVSQMDMSLLHSLRQVTPSLPGLHFLTCEVRRVGEIISESPFSSRTWSSPSEAQKVSIPLSVLRSTSVAGLGTQVTPGVDNIF